MKKFLIFTMVAALLSITTVAFAGDSGFYMGIGVSHISEIDNTGFGDVCTQNLEVGYKVNSLISYGLDVNVDLNADLQIYMLKGKISPDLGSRVVRPFVTAGFGYMKVADVYNTGSLTDPGLKAGAGIDFFTCENVSVGFEITYFQGLRDLRDLQALDYALGLHFHF